MNFRHDFNTQVSTSFENDSVAAILALPGILRIVWVDFLKFASRRWSGCSVVLWVPELRAYLTSFLIFLAEALSTVNIPAAIRLGNKITLIA